MKTLLITLITLNSLMFNVSHAASSEARDTRISQAIQEMLITDGDTSVDVDHYEFCTLPQTNLQIIKDCTSFLQEENLD